MGRTAATSTRLIPRIGRRTKARPGRRRSARRLDHDAHGAPPNSEQHRWRRLLAVALAFAVVSWLISTALVSFAFVTVVKQNDDHVAALTDLLEEGQAQRGSLVGSAKEQTEQRQAVLLNERAKTRVSSAEARESRASREAALADAERSQSEATRAEPRLAPRTSRGPWRWRSSAWLRTNSEQTGCSRRPRLATRTRRRRWRRPRRSWRRPSSEQPIEPRGPRRAGKGPGEAG